MTRPKDAPRTSLATCECGRYRRYTSRTCTLCAELDGRTDKDRAIIRALRDFRELTAYELALHAGFPQAHKASSLRRTMKRFVADGRVRSVLTPGPHNNDMITYVWVGDRKTL